MMQHLISIQDLSVQLILAIFRRTGEFKRKPVQPVLKNKNLAMIFQKPSTRTRVSFEVAMDHLGGHALYLNTQDLQLGGGETVADTARTLSRYCDAIMARVFSHNDVLELAKHSGVPVINGLSDLLHPCQALSDMYTIHERLGRLKGLKLAYTGDGNNVTHSLLYACSKLGINMSVACPAKHAPEKDVLRESRANARSSGAVIEVTPDPKKALKGADVVYTDTWFSIGQKPSKSKKRAMKPYQLSSSLLRHAKRNALVMHCLPAHRGQEITDPVIDGPQSVVWDQAENRLHVQKGILSLLI
jgi:ornithine carbamoyltransferase